ncbi:transposase [Thermomonas sp.]|uniref:transposase n=1 Tax=Thermomonas sp. TaxID=1971895 RepID=UPI002616F4FD|nr:transposase [Thermomonas sp.]MBL0227700.1 transposase [Thermomonas sp.]
MPRQARIEVPGIPMHVTQRGVNRCAIFLDDEDRHHYRRLLREACTNHDVLVHAYVLMDNHVHLLLHAEQAGAVSRAMRAIGQAYVQAFNQRHGRIGTLWQGRYKSSLVDSEAYALRVIRYIELNPVRAAMVDAPEAHRWSSVHMHLGLRQDALLTPHVLYLSLGDTPAARAHAYRAWLMSGTDDEELTRIRAHIAQEKALGNPRFQTMLEKTLNRPVDLKPRGRPALSKGDGGN